MGASIIFPILLGFIAAWLVNYCADVLPASLRFSRPACPSPDCQKPFGWGDYLLLRSCKHCGRRRSVRTFVVIGLGLVAAIYLWLSAPAKLGFGLGLLTFSYFLCVGIIDLEHRLILGPLSLTGLVIGGGTGWLMHGWQRTLIGGGVGFALMMVFYLFGRLFSSARARQRGEDPKQAEEALGSGDVTLATVLGLFLGWPLIWFGLLVGALFAGVVSVLIIVMFAARRKYKQNALMVYIPIGPMFIVSAILIIYLPFLISRVLPK